MSPAQRELPLPCCPLWPLALSLGMPLPYVGYPNRMSWTWKPPHIWQREWGTAMHGNLLVLEVLSRRKSPRTPYYPFCGFDKATCLPYISLNFEKDLLLSKLVVSDLYSWRSPGFSPTLPAAAAPARLRPCPADSRERDGAALQTLRSQQRLFATT